MDEPWLEAAIRDISDPRLVMQRVVDQALALIPGAEGAVVELVDGEYLTYACASGSLAGHVGLRLRVATSLSGLAVQTGQTLHCRDAAVDPRVDGDACRAVGAVSMVCVPLGLESVQIGTLKVSSPRSGAFSEHDVATLGQLAEFISIAVRAESELSRVAEQLLARRAHVATSASDEAKTTARSHAERRRGIEEFVAQVLRPEATVDLRTRRRIERTLSERAWEVIGQPIVDVTSGELVGIEALTRFHGPPAQSPDRWFDDAQAAGLGVALEIAAAQTALELLDHAPAAAFVAINIGPTAIATSELRDMLRSAKSGRVVLELTEHLRVEDYPALSAALHDLRTDGVRLAVDDAGAGFSSLAHIVNLAPDLIKLDRHFTGSIDLDPVRRALAAALVTFAHQTGAEVVAEGVETADELETIRELAIPYAQGYFIARPAPIAHLRRALPMLGQAARRPAA
jgi:EAL domain-containing protein (putative c-di-GMP-specific phosphodiesterase class I)